MSAFDKIIGYDKIKTELMQISDMIHRPDAYAALGARMPKGLLLDGAPGLGKTLMAMALMEDSGVVGRLEGGTGLLGFGVGLAGFRDRHRQ